MYNAPISQPLSESNMYGYIENEAAYERAIRRNIVNNARTTFMKRERAQEVMNWVYSARGEFAASLANSLETYGKLTDGQFAAVIKCIDNAAVRKAEWEAKRMVEAAKSNFVGSEGGKISLTNVKVEKVMTVDAPAFFYHDRNSQEIYLLRDEDGNRLVFKTKKEMDIQQGDVVNLTAKVKRHSEYNFEKQTLINYAKFTVVPQEVEEVTTETAV
jgi:hypothetical protein